MAYIDLHTHITWNVDDGIETKEDSLKALEMAKKDGIDALVLTPHFIPGRFKQDDYDEITEVMQECVDLAKTVGVQAYMGSELFLNEDYLDMVDQHLFHSINQTKYLLVEYDVRKDMNQNDSAEDKLYELIIRGYIPVIAHVERYFHSKMDISRVKEWIEMGCVIQVNRTSLLGLNGKKVKENAIQLIENNLAHVLSTDAHRIEGNRICRMSDAYEFLKENYGKKNADLLCFGNANHILNSEDVEKSEVVVQKSLFSRLFKRR